MHLKQWDQVKARVLLKLVFHAILTLDWSCKFIRHNFSSGFFQTEVWLLVETGMSFLWPGTNATMQFVALIETDSSGASSVLCSPNWTWSRGEDHLIWLALCCDVKIWLARIKQMKVLILPASLCWSNSLPDIETSARKNQNQKTVKFWVVFHKTWKVG